MSQLVSDYKRALQGFNRNIRLMLVYFALNAIGNGIVSVLFNLYFLKLGLDENFLGSMVLIQSLVIAIAGVPFGMFADRAQKHKMVKASFVMMNVFFTLMLFIKDPVPLLIMYGLNSIGVAVAAASEFPYICENVPPESRTHLFSINMAMWTAGPSIGMAIGGYLPKIAGALLSADPEGAFAYQMSIFAAQALFWLSGFAVLRTSVGHLAEKHPGGAIRFKFSRPAVVLGLCANTAFVGLAASLFIPFLNVIFNQRFGLPAHSIGWLFTVQNALISLGALLVPRLGQKRGNLGGYAILQAITLPMYVLLAVSRSLPVFTVAYILRGLMANISAPLFDSYTSSAVNGSERGSVTATLSFSRNLMWAAGGKIGGMFLAKASYSPPIMLASISYALAVAISFWMTKHPKTREAAPSIEAAPVELTAEQ